MRSGYGYRAMVDSPSAPLTDTDTDASDLGGAVPSVDPHDAVIAEALGVIDGALGRMSGREIVSSNEVADLLLDVRTLLTQPTGS